MAVFWLSQVTAEQTYAASRTTTDLEKEKVEVSFCHCCHERMPTLNHDFVVDGMVRKTISFPGLLYYSHQSVSPLVTLGMFCPISLQVSAGKGRILCLVL